MRWLIVAFLVFAPRLAMAADSRGYMAVITGECKLSLLDNFVPCNSKVVNTVANGHLSMIFHQDRFVFLLEGLSDRQPNLENYYMSVSQFTILEKNKAIATDTSMEGECHMSLNAEGSELYYIYCDIYDRSKGALFRFHLDNIISTDRQPL